MTRINVEMVAKDQRIACVHLGDVCEDNGVCCTAAVTMWWCSEERGKTITPRKFAGAKLLLLCPPSQRLALVISNNSS